MFCYTTKYLKLFLLLDIEYDIKKQLLSAKGQSSETGKNMSRVKIVIPPQNKENTEKEGQK